MSKAAPKTPAKKPAKKDASGDLDASQPEQKCILLGRIVEAKELEIARQQLKLSEQEAFIRDLRYRVQILEAELTEQRGRMNDCITDVTRQHLTTKEQLLRHVEEATVQVDRMRDQLQQQKVEFKQQLDQRDATIAQKDQQLSMYQKRMDSMAVEFSGMLQKTLEKMSEKIEISGDWRLTSEAVQRDKFSAMVCLYICLLMSNHTLCR